MYIFSGTKVIAEYNLGAAATSPNKEYIYAGSSLLATISGSTTTYHHPDHLSVRLDTDSSGNVLGQQGHYPFGEQDISICVTSNDTSHKFTGDERDTETNLDHTWFRKYTSAQGRWMTPDPAGLAAVDPTNPQSWNRYSYVLNDPLDFVDPLGLEPPCGDPDPHVFNDALQTQNWGDYYFWSGGIAGLGGLGEVVTGGNGKCHDAQRHGGNGGSGGGTTIGPPHPPTMKAAPVIACSSNDLFIRSLEFSVDYGFSAKIPAVADVGMNLFRNLNTGETGLSLSAKALIGLELKGTNPSGVPLGSDVNPRIDVSIAYGPGKYNLATKKSEVGYTLGGSFLVGGDVTFNYDKFKQLASVCTVVY